jgi:uncharacterized SAM-binding protein YcdF (DUF218 family)
MIAVAAVCFGAQLVFVFAGPPRPLVEWLTGENLNPPKEPRYIVVLGGGGIPSGTSLLRTWHAARFGNGLTGTTFIVSLPADATPDISSVGRMRDELVLRGIPASAIQMETRGLNTHEQAVNVAKMMSPDHSNEPVVIVTSGFHMRRSLLSFRKAGLTNVDGLFAYSIGAEADLGPNMWLRYSVWGNRAHEADIARELAGLVVYKLCGWI